MRVIITMIIPPLQWILTSCYYCIFQVTLNLDNSSRLGSCPRGGLCYTIININDSCCSWSLIEFVLASDIIPVLFVCCSPCIFLSRIISAVFSIILYLVLFYNVALWLNGINLKPGSKNVHRESVLLFSEYLNPSLSSMFDNNLFTTSDTLWVKLIFNKLLYTLKSP